MSHQNRINAGDQLETVRLQPSLSHDWRRIDKQDMLAGLARTSIMGAVFIV